MVSLGQQPERQVGEMSYVPPQKISGSERMREKLNRSLLGIALVGVGRAWETHYREAVQRLRSKLALRAVCDPVHVRAASVADEFRAATYSSPWKLAQRRDIQAWLICDPGWFGTYPAELAVRRDQPILFANCFTHDPQQLVSLFTQSINRSESLVAEFPNRFAPATIRLRELLATKLGRVQRIEIDVPVPSCGEVDLVRWLSAGRAFSLGLLDWCACLIGRPVAEVDWSLEESRPELRLSFTSATDASNTAAPTASLRFSCPSETESPLHRRRLECERGVATSDNPNHVLWQTEADHASESLTHERSPFEIILDQFCRRAAGGLVPIPSLSEALNGLAVLAAATEALSSRQAVSVKSPPPG